MENKRFKVGDHVRIKSLDWYNKNKSNGTVVYSDGRFEPGMKEWCDEIMTILEIEETCYIMNEDGARYLWTDEMIEGLVEEEEIEFTEEDKYWCDIMSESDPTTYVLPQGYQFVDENGNIINTTKIVLEKKEKSYPKSYEECCYVLGFENTELVFEDDYRNINPPKEQWKRLGLINQFNKLLICRDAYWKIAGEEMGLDGPWKPDYKKERYVISRYTDEIVKGYRQAGLIEHFILEFPTEEMRDAFYENFKEEIKSVKELL